MYCALDVVFFTVLAIEVMSDIHCIDGEKSSILSLVQNIS